MTTTLNPTWDQHTAVRAAQCLAAASEPAVSDPMHMSWRLTERVHRRTLWVLGNQETLSSSPPWAAFMQHARRSGCMLSAARPFSSLLRASLSSMRGAPVFSRSTPHAASKRLCSLWPSACL